MWMSDAANGSMNCTARLTRSERRRREMSETRRIEMANIDIDKNEISVDFQFGPVLLNINFRKSDLSMLAKLLRDLRENFEDLEAETKTVEDTS